MTKTRLSVLQEDPTAHAMRHWNAVLRSREVRRKPVAIRVHGRDIAVFRDSAGRLAAVDDSCPHRRAKLSTGKVVGDTLVCPYHMAAVTRTGDATKPATPKWKACVPHYDVAEHGDLIWVKTPGADAPLPKMEFEGFQKVGVLKTQWASPLELTLDNFAEFEHAIAVHPTFGGGVDTIIDGEQRIDLSEDEVITQFLCTQKPWPRIVHLLSGIRRGDQFSDTWSFKFSPLTATFHGEWFDSTSGAKRRAEFYMVVTFTPADADNTVLTLSVYLPTKLRIPTFIQVLNTHILQRLELIFDERAVANLHRDPDLANMKLGKFDRSIAEVRKRLTRVYYGRDRRTARTIHAKARASGA